MLVFINLGGPVSGQQWYVGPLLMLIPMLLSGGLLDLITAVVYTILSPILSLLGLLPSLPQQQSTANHQATDQRRPATNLPEDDDDLVLSIINLVIALIGVYTIYRLVRYAHGNGGWRGVVRLLFTGAAGGTAAAGAAAAAHPAGRRPGQRPQHSFDQVAGILQKLPMEEHATATDLESMATSELKERLTKRGVNCSNFLERRELVEKLMSDGGSSATSCSICCEDYCSGDAVRVLPCHHRFHIECVDKWFLSATDYSRPPACPLCNAELIKGAEAAAAAAAGGPQH